MTAVAEAPPVPKIRPIHESRVKSDGASTSRNRYFATAEEGTPFEAVCDPAYWAHVAEGKQPYDVISIACDDEAWYGEVMVRSVAPQSVYVTVLSFLSFNEETVPDVFTDSYQVKWRGPHHKFSVIRLSDKAAIQGGFANRALANRWLSDNAKTLVG